MKKQIAILALTLLATSVATAAEPSPTPQPDKLKEALAQVITGVTQNVSDAKEFIVAQLPDVVRQLLIWKFAESLARMALPLIFLLIFGVAFKRLTTNKCFETVKWDYTPGPKNVTSFVAGIICAAGTSISLLLSIFNLNLEWLQIWLAPKVYLIEYVKSLTGK